VVTGSRVAARLGVAALRAGAQRYGEVARRVVVLPRGVGVPHAVAQRCGAAVLRVVGRRCVAAAPPYEVRRAPQREAAGRLDVRPAQVRPAGQVPQRPGLASAVRRSRALPTRLRAGTRLQQRGRYASH